MNLRRCRLLSLALITTSSASNAAVEVMDLGGQQVQLTFRLTPDQADVRTVHVAGTFNGWSPTAEPLSKDAQTGVFETRLVVPAGRHEYKFVFNGSIWVTDPDNTNRTPGYENAIVWAGVDRESAPTAPLEPSDMPAIAEHPPLVTALAHALNDEADRNLERFFKAHPMPAFTAETVTFVYAGEPDNPPTLYIDAHGTRWGYPLQQLPDASHVFVLTLRRGDLPERWAYRYAVQHAGRQRILCDPHAWSVTSRSGAPASAGVAAGADRGRIDLVPDFAPQPSPLAPRDIYVYLPPGYDAHPDRRYPVLYLHDGQNCWDDPVEPFGHGGWCINRIADELITAGRIEPFIGVGLANTPQRLAEYGPGKNIRSANEHPYIQLLVRHVKPYIDKRYRTRPDAKDTALMGSSMGGAISLQTALLCPDTFGAAACLSTAFLFEDDAGHDYGDLVQAVGKQPVRLYLDSGTAGPRADGRDATQAMVDRLQSAGWRPSEDLVHYEDAGAQHNERAWRARVHRPLEFLFGRR